MADSEVIFYYDRSQKRGVGGGIGDVDEETDGSERTQTQKQSENGPRRKKPRVLGSRYDPGFESKLEDILFNDIKKVDFSKGSKKVEEEEDLDVDDILSMLGTATGKDAEEDEDEDEDEEEIVLTRKTPQQQMKEITRSEDSEDEAEDEEEDSEQSDEEDSEAEDSEEEDSEEEEEEEEEEGEDEQKTGAWVDEDDEEVQVSLKKNAKRLKKLRGTFEEDVVSGTDFQKRLRQQHQKFQLNTDWASLDGNQKKKAEEAEDDEDDILRSTSSKLGAKGYRLPQGHLDVLRLKDANQADYSKSGGEITSLAFHPDSSILLCASERDQTVRLFDVDGKVNPKLHGVTFRDLPPLCCFFNTGEKAEIVCTGRRKYFYVYDLHSGNVSKVQGIQGHDQKSLERCYPSPDGKYLVVLGGLGYIHILSNTTKQWIAAMKMNTRAEAAAFTPDSRYLITTGGDGSIYQWDMNTRRCFNRYVDSGSLSTLSISISSNGSTQATGTKSGVVNIYDLPSITSSKPSAPTPRKGLMNLTNGVTDLAFNHDSQLLAMSSRFKRDALRLVHMPSLTVFSNWPSSSTPVQTPTALAFSSKSEMLAIGNQRGAVLLYKLNHYDNSSSSSSTSRSVATSTKH